MKTSQMSQNENRNFFCTNCTPKTENLCLANSITEAKRRATYMYKGGPSPPLTHKKSYIHSPSVGPTTVYMYSMPPLGGLNFGSIQNFLSVLIPSSKFLRFRTSLTITGGLV